MSDTSVMPLDARSFRGRWILCRATRPLGGDRDSIAIRYRGGPEGRWVSHLFTVSEARHAAWIGRIPPEATDLAIEATGSTETVSADGIRIKVLSRPELVARASLIDLSDTILSVAWRLTGKRLRARASLATILRVGLYRSLGSGSFESDDRSDYEQWLALNDSFSDEDLAELSARVEAWPEAPLISVLMPVYDPVPADLEEAIGSVRAQLYGRFELCIADDASTDPKVAEVLARAAAADPRVKVVTRPENGHISAASNSALELCTGTFTALMDHDDVIPPHALLFVARELMEHPATDLVYSDEDKIDERGRRYMPHFKSDWNEELFLTQNYVNHLGVYRTEILRKIGGFRVGLEGSQDHDLVLRLLDHTHETRIRHIPRVLYHWRNHRATTSFSERSMAKAVAARRRALVDHVARRGWDAEVVEGAIGANRLIRKLPDPAPEVAVIIPTRDMPDLLRTVCEGVLERTDYPRLRVVVIDNCSREYETLRYLEELRRNPRVTILPAPDAFNYSALNNEAAALADSELLCFLNNDIEVIEPNWLRELVSSLMPGVAATGARLLYPDRTLQHGGVILGGGGVAGHAQLDISEEDPGYFGRALLPQYLSAVTGACLLVRKNAFQAVGGFDARALAIAFNDIDLCLKLRAEGWKIAYTPYAKLIHHESLSRGSDATSENRARFDREIATMHKRWGSVLTSDPYYNPNLDLDFADFRLRGAFRPGRDAHRGRDQTPAAQTRASHGVNSP